MSNVVQNDFRLTPVERVLLDFLLDVSGSFSAHADERHALTTLETDIQKALHRALKKIDYVTTAAPRTAGLTLSGVTS